MSCNTPYTPSCWLTRLTMNVTQKWTSSPSLKSSYLFSTWHNISQTWCGDLHNITACTRDQLMQFFDLFAWNKESDACELELSQHTVSGGCAAWHRPKGSCKDIAALCYPLEEFWLLNSTWPVHPSCRSGNWPQKRTLVTQNADKIKFVKLERRKI